ncbi:MAG TPA: hypothetical protein VMW07_04450 [Gallionella sp.]|nr:hypothetical protein [Gallionella sp.]
MNGILFVVKEASESGMTARAIDESIFTGADNMGNLLLQVCDAVHCHFDEDKTPQKIIPC